MSRARKGLLELTGVLVLLAVVAAVLVAQFDPNRYKGAAVDYLQTHYQRTLVLGGPITLRLFPRLEVAIENASLSEPGQPQQPFAQIASARLAVRLLPLLHHRLVVDRVEAKGLRLHYRRDADGRRNFDDLLKPAADAPPANGPDRPAQPLQLDISAIELEQLQLDVDDRRLPARGQVQLARFSSGRLGAGTSAPVRVSARLDLAEPAVQAQLDGGLQLRLDLGDAARALRADARDIDLTLQGRLPGLPRLAARLEGTLGYDGAQGRADASPQAAHWQVEGTLNGQGFRTGGALALGGPRPVLQADARFGELDLDALLPPKAAPAGGAASAPRPPAGSGAPDRPVDLAVLHTLDGRISLQAGTLRHAPYVLRNVKAVAVLAGGTLDLQPLAFDTWDGSVTARLRASAAGAQTVALSAQAQRIDIAQALRDVAQSTLLEGRGQVALDLRSGGRTLQALKAGLAGDARVELRDGAVRGFNLAKGLRQFQAALSGARDATSTAQQTEKTDFSELTASLRFTNGIGRSQDLDVKSPFLRLGGEGSVNLPAGTLDYTLRASVINTSKGQGGADLAALHGVTVPVRLQGPFDALNWQIRWSQVAAGAARNTLKQQLGDKLREELRGQLGTPAASDAASQPSDAELREKAREKLKERLKGLLR